MQCGSTAWCGKHRREAQQAQHDHSTCLHAGQVASDRFGGEGSLQQAPGARKGGERTGRCVGGWVGGLRRAGVSMLLPHRICMARLLRSRGTPRDRHGGNETLRPTRQSTAPHFRRVWSFPYVFTIPNRPSIALTLSG